MSPPLNPRVHICLFGPLEIRAGISTLGPRDLGGARPKQVLQLLLAARGHRVTTDRLAELLWGSDPPANASGSLQTFISVLRSRLSADRELSRKLVITEAEAYRFATDLVELDLDRFDELLERSAHEPTRPARRSLEQALALVRGEVLEDEPYAGWAEELRRTYRGRVLGAQLDAADAALAELDYAAALSHTEAAVALDRYSERAHRSGALALYALGRQHDALELYRRFRSRINDDLGLAPTAETRALETAILRQDDVRVLLPRPIGGTVAAVRSVRFVGREAELEELQGATRAGLEGSLALLQVESETGLGKTRLIDEMAASLQDVRIGRSRCSRLEQHLPYVPLAAALRDALEGIDMAISARPGLAVILPELAPQRGVQVVAEVDALEALVALVAKHAPLVLFLDDLHWADPQTIAALSYLQRRGIGVNAVIVTAVGTEHAPADHAIRGLCPTTVVRLGTLTERELEPLGIPELHESTGGDPRLVTEAISSGDRGALSAALADALRAQCRAEGAWAYRVLLAASMLDQPFEPEPLADLLRIDAAELLEELERLCERRVLRIEGLRFRFRYELVREVLLTAVSPARQRLVRERLRPSHDERLISHAG